MEEGDISSFFVQGLGLALVAKTCPHRPQAFKEANTCQAFGRKTYIYIYNIIYNICFSFFLKYPIAGTLRHAYRRFARKLDDLTA